MEARRAEENRRSQNRAFSGIRDLTGTQFGSPALSVHVGDGMTGHVLHLMLKFRVSYRFCGAPRLEVAEAEKGHTAQVFGVSAPYPAARKVRENRKRTPFEG